MTSPKTPSKLAILIRKASGAKGVSLEALCKATGWQAHSVRAALSGLRKRGHVIERQASVKPGRGPIYRIVSGPVS